MAFATGLGNGARAKGLGKDGRSALVTLASANPDTARRLGELFAAASKTIATASSPTPERLAAIDLLAHSDAATAGAAFQSLIAPQTPNELQAAAVRALSQLPGAKAGEWFVERERWRSYTPPVRDAVLTALLSQPPVLHVWRATCALQHKPIRRGRPKDGVISFAVAVIISGNRHIASATHPPGKLSK